MLRLIEETNQMGDLNIEYYLNEVCLRCQDRFCRRRCCSVVRF